MRDDVESRFIAGPAGRLDSRWHGPPAGRPVLLLHPHPLLGGTMGSRLVYDVALALAAAGRRAVRFDFRGVGRSEGGYGNGEGEVQDACAAWDALQAGARAAGQRHARPDVVGYSFGAGVAARLARLRPVARLVLVAPPPRIASSALAPIDDAPHVPARVTVIAGDQDPYVSAAKARGLADAFRPPADLVLLAGAGHFLEPSRNAAVADAVLQALAP